MANDNVENMGNVELVSSEVTGYLGEDGQFKYGKPEDAKPEVFTQDAEDAIAG